VLEYVPGQTLQGPLPVENAIEVASQIMAALEEAHSKGIVHRDLKPANVKITPEGKVKVLDFGLAKAFSGEAAEGDPAHSPTLSALATRLGTILGTASYMSPEQARGRPFDKRTDVWSFGCVLYELLTGRQAFSGDNVTDILAAVVGRDPDWTKLPAETPRVVVRLLRLCLEKDPARRLRDIGDAWIASDEQPAAAPPPPPAPKRAWIPWALLALVTGAAAAGLWLMRAPAPTPRPVVHFTAAMPQLTRFSSIALSPDGSRLAYSAGAPSRLHVRLMDQLEGKPIPGTENGIHPVFSPDGQWLGFLQDNKWKKVQVVGGATITLCDASSSGGVGGADWGPDGTIIFGTETQGLSKVSAAGGEPQAVTTLDSKRGDRAHRWPQFLPGGQAVLFAAGSAAFDDARIVALALKTGQQRVLIEGGTFPRYAPTGPAGGPSGPGKRGAGHIVYWRSGSLFAVPFDAGRLELTGSPVPILEGVRGATTNGLAVYSFSDAGGLVYQAGGSSGGQQRQLAWVDRQGKATPIPAPPHPYVEVRLSPEGQRSAVGIVGGSGAAADIWVYDLPRGTLTRLTFQGGNYAPVWTPDGKRVTFLNLDAGKRTLAWTLADGSGPPETLLQTERARPTSWSPDGKLLAFDDGVASQSDILLLARPDGGTPSAPAPRPFLKTQHDEGGAMFSPDARWIAYTSRESGQPQVYVRPAAPGPGGVPGGKWQVSTDGGSHPRWTAGGRELVYRLPDRLMAVAIEPGSTFRAGTPKELFRYVFRQFLGGAAAAYDASADGKRFVVIQSSAEPSAATSEVHFVLEWFEDLRRRVRAGG